MKYLFLGLAVLTLILIVALVVILIGGNKNQGSGSASVSGGIDIDNGKPGSTNFNGIYNDLDTVDSGSICIKSGNIGIQVFLEERKSMNRFTAVVAGNEVVIGRLVDGYPNINNISVSRSNNVSRRHCKLFANAGNLYIANLSGTTVTRLNEIPVNNPMPLHVGDLITLGDTQLSVIGIQ